MTHEEFCKGLRQLADWYEVNPQINKPSYMLSVYCTTEDKDVAIATAQALRTFKKDYTQSFFTMSKEFSGITLTFYFSRDEVCTKKVLGTKSVPDRYEPGYLVAAHEEEIVEWECPESLLADPLPQAPNGAGSTEAEAS
jgi:hypothetical protein